MYLRSYALQKAWLDTCLKSTSQEHRLTVYMLKIPKHGLNQHGSSFIIFLYITEANRGGKCLSL